MNWKITFHLQLLPRCETLLWYLYFMMFWQRGNLDMSLKIFLNFHIYESNYFYRINSYIYLYFLLCKWVKLLCFHILCLQICAFNYVINKKLLSQKIEIVVAMLSQSKKREVFVLFFLTVTIKYNNEFSQRMVNHKANHLYWISWQ